MHKKWTFPQPFQHRSRLLFYHEGVSCALFQQMPGVFHISQGSKKNFSTAKNFFPHSFFGKISDFHRNCVEKCRNVWKNDSKFTQLSTSFPKPHAPQPQKFPRPAFSARSFFAAHFFFVAASKFPERSARVFYHQRKIHARISAENPSIKIRPYFRQKPAKNPHEIRKNH